MMPMQPDSGGDEQSILQKLIAELEQLAQAGQGNEAAQRLGKVPMPAPGGDLPPDPAGLEGSPEEEMGEDPATEDMEPVPGAEQDAGGDELAGKPDPMKMRALLAKLKGSSPG